jgi:hypothetical protein
MSVPYPAEGWLATVPWRLVERRLPYFTGNFGPERVGIPGTVWWRLCWKNPDDASLIIGVWAYANFVITEFSEVELPLSGVLRS